jgi:hypothetical protein
MRDYKRRQGVNFSIYFPADEYDDLMALVAEQDEPRAAVIRRIVRDHVKRVKRRKKAA